MDLKNVDEFLKNKVGELKDEKNRSELLAIFAILGDNLVGKITDAIKNLVISPPEVKVNVPDVHIPEQKAPIMPEFPPYPAFPAFPAFPEVKIPTINVPEIKIPTINVPEPKVTVNIPKSDAPVVNVAPTPVTFPDSMRLTPNDKPFPVIMVDGAGKPMMLSGGGGGGRADFFTIKDIQTSTGGSIISDTENAIRITGTVTTSGSVGTTASALVDSSGVQYSGSNPLPITGNITTIAGATGQGDAATAQRVVIAGNSDASVIVNSGTITTVTTLTGITNSVATALIDSSGIQYSGTNPIPISTGSTLDVRQVSGASWSVAASVQGNSWLNITGAATSTVVKTGAGVLHSITINKRGTGSVCNVFGDLVGEGSSIASIDTTLSTTAFLYDIAFVSGLTIATTGAGAADLTISYT